MSRPAILPAREKRLIVAAAIPLVVAFLALGYAVQSGVMLRFAIVWPILQLGGYWFTLRMSGRRFDHPLVKQQIMLHYLVLALLAALIVRAS